SRFLPLFGEERMCECIRRNCMSVQIIIIAAYFLLTLVVGVVTSKGTNNKEFHGKQLGVAAIVCASAGEWLGGTATTGVSEYGFIYGISGAWYTIANGLGVLFLAIFFAKIYRSIGRMTIPGIIEHVFGRKAQIVSSILLVFVMLAVGMSQIIAAGKFGEALLGIDFYLSAIVFTCIFVVYTLAGGMKAVSSTNTMHLFVMYLGILVTVIILITRIGGWGDFTRAISEIDGMEGTNHLSMMAIGFPKISSWVIASLLGACTAQAGIQPVLGAKDASTARKACFYTALVTAPFGIMTALIGIVGKVMSEQGSLLDLSGNIVTDGKLALTSVMMTLPPFIGGLVLAAELAAILSTASPIILAAGTMLTKDFYQTKINSFAGEKELLAVSRITTAISGFICCLGAIALVNNNNVLDIVYSAYSLRGAIFVVLIYGFVWKKANVKAACLSMICTGAVAISWVLFKLIFGHYPIASWFTETYAAVITAALTMLILSIFFNKVREGQ
ncbi:MAG: sodium:solute symporter family protein, partial [Oscillospiraceae bacterium]|nr:sodium:solute symporter family protein [Oscillospiraceae bacterium]